MPITPTPEFRIVTPRLSQPLLFIASDRREAQPWVAQWEDRHPLNLPVHWARAGTWRGRDAIAVANGVGVEMSTAAVHAAATVADRFAAICSIGTGGALDPSLAIGDIVVATSVQGDSAAWAALDPNGPLARSGLIRTNRHIARTAEEKSNLSRSGAILVDMEAAGVAAAADELAVPFYCVRVVSDLAGETFFIDFERFLMADGRFNVSRLVMFAMAHPAKGFPELLRLQRRTSAAANKLGHFLANCRF
jgi:adenosylhomocysteine nucleosidase